MASNSRVEVTFDGTKIRTQHLRSTFLRLVEVSIMSNGLHTEISGWFNRLLWKMLDKKKINQENFWLVHISEEKW